MLRYGESMAAREPQSVARGFSITLVGRVANPDLGTTDER